MSAANGFRVGLYIYIYIYIYISKSPAGNPATVPRLVVGSGWCGVVVVCLWCLVFGVVV